MRPRALTVVVLLVLAACSEPAPSVDPETGLEVLDARPAFRASAGATDWSESSEAPPGMGASDTEYDDLGTLLVDLRALAAEAGSADVLMGLLGAPTDEDATVVMHVPRTGDDSVLGTEVVVSLARSDRGWHVVSAQVRDHCRRGVDTASQSCL